MGIDFTHENQFCLTTQSAIARNLPMAGGGGGPQGGADAVAVESTLGRTNRDALNERRKTSNRFVDLGHNRVVVIGEELARQGIEEVLEVLMRSGRIDNSLWLAVSRGPAKDIIASKPKEEVIPAIYLENLFSRSGDRPAVYPRVHLWEAYARYLSPPQQMFLPVLKAEEDKVYVEGTALFKGSRLTGWLDGEETQIFLWLTNQARAGDYIVPTPAENQSQVHVLVKSARGKIAVDIDAGKPLLVAELSVAGLILETGKVQLHDAQDIQVLEKQSENYLARQLEALIATTQTINSDVIGFGNYLRSRHPETWKELEWDNVFPETPIKVKVKVSLNVSWPNI